MVCHCFDIASIAPRYTSTAQTLRTGAARNMLSHIIFRRNGRVIYIIQCPASVGDEGCRVRDRPGSLENDNDATKLDHRWRSVCMTALAPFGTVLSRATRLRSFT